MTAGAMREDRKRCLEAGMDDYVAKPVNPNDLVRVFERWLPQKEQTGQGDVRTGDEQTPALRQKDEIPSVLDRDALLERMMGDESLAQEVLRLFLDTLPQRMHELEQALVQGNAELAHMASHSIKGMAANTCADALSTLAGEMECAARNNEIQKARTMMSELRKQFETLQRAAWSNEG